MSDVMVVVDRSNRKAEERDAGKVMGPGDLFTWTQYVTKNSLIAKYLEPGDRMFLVTARGERLWLVAVYEGVQLGSKKGSEYTWVATERNRVPIIDITALRTRLKFHKGTGLTKEPGKLGNSLQSPRLLTANDLELLEAAIRKRSSVKILKPRRVSTDAEAIEGEKLIREVCLYTRDPGLVLKCLKRDEYTCRCCGFAVDKTRFPSLFEKITWRIVQAHHVRLVSAGKRKTMASDLLTLCPTCHVVAHALAVAEKVTTVDLKLLEKSYRPTGVARYRLKRPVRGSRLRSTLGS